MFSLECWARLANAPEWVGWARAADGPAGLVEPSWRLPGHLAATWLRTWLRTWRDLAANLARPGCEPGATWLRRQHVRRVRSLRSQRTSVVPARLSLPAEVAGYQ
jgi:hypothetical protein